MSAEILAQAEEFGIKRICQSCSVKYYDLNKAPIICPACETEFDPEAILSRRRSRIADEAKPKGQDPEEDQDEEATELETEEDVAADIPDVEVGDDSEFGEQADDATLLEEDDDDTPLLPEVMIESHDDTKSE